MKTDYSPSPAALRELELLQALVDAGIAADEYIDAWPGDQTDRELCERYIRDGTSSPAQIVAHYARQ